MDVQVSELVVGFVDGGVFFSHVSFEVRLSLFFTGGIGNQSGGQVVRDFV